jgi:hypothetical protein
LPRFCRSLHRGRHKIPFFCPAADTPKGLFAWLWLANGEIAMNFMASGRSALIITAGLWLCLAAPIGAQQSDQDATANSASDATATDNPADAPVAPNKPVKPRPKRPAAAQSHQPAKVASKPLNSKKTDDAQALQDDPSTSGFPSSVSNAKAQFGAGGSGLANSALKTMSTQADMPGTATQVDPATAPAEASAANGALVAPNQVNDVDRTMGQDTAPAPTLSMMVPQTPSAVSNVDSTWGRTSLIGKVFVALGGLLTLASAARMFIA